MKCVSDYLSKTMWGEITSLSLTASAIRGVTDMQGFFFFFFLVVTREKILHQKRVWYIIKWKKALCQIYNVIPIPLVTVLWMIFSPSPCFSLQQTCIILTKSGKSNIFFFEVLTCHPMDYSVERTLLCAEDQLCRWNFPEKLTVFCLTQWQMLHMMIQL